MARGAKIEMVSHARGAWSRRCAGGRESYPAFLTCLTTMVALVVLLHTTYTSKGPAYSLLHFDSLVTRPATILSRLDDVSTPAKERPPTLLLGSGATTAPADGGNVDADYNSFLDVVEDRERTPAHVAHSFTSNPSASDTHPQSSADDAMYVKGRESTLESQLRVEHDDSFQAMRLSKLKVPTVCISKPRLTRSSRNYLSTIDASFRKLGMILGEDEARYLGLV